MSNESTSLHLPDNQQTSWQLAAIQLSGWTSLPILATSILILEKNSFLGAIFTIIVGNAILWFLRLGILSMSYEKRQSTLDISKDYLGNWGSYFIAILLLASTVAWFITQTTSASDALTHLITIQESPEIDKFTQMSVFVGIVSAFLCMEGMILLRRLCVIVFPLILVAFFAILLLVPAIDYKSDYPLSFYGLTFVLATNLGITSDLPTFFRHSASWQTSVKALTVVQLASLGLGICGLYFSSILSDGFKMSGSVLASGNEILRLALIVFVFLSVICANVANVYSASVGWEVLAPKALVGRKEYLILGLGLTTIFILVANVFSIEFLLNVTDNSLVNLCMILIVGYVVSRIFGKLPSLGDKSIYFFGWLVSTSLNVLQFAGFIYLQLSEFAVSILVVGFAFILVSMNRLVLRK